MCRKPIPEGTGVQSWWSKIYMSSKIHVYACILQMLEQIMVVFVLASSADQWEWIYRVKWLEFRTRCPYVFQFLPQPSFVRSHGLGGHKLLKCIRYVPAAHLLFSVSWDESMSHTTTLSCERKLGKWGAARRFASEVHSQTELKH